MPTVLLPPGTLFHAPGGRCMAGVPEFEKECVELLLLVIGRVAEFGENCKYSRRKEAERAGTTNHIQPKPTTQHLRRRFPNILDISSVAFHERLQSLKCFGKKPATKNFPTLGTGLESKHSRSVAWNDGGTNTKACNYLISTKKNKNSRGRQAVSAA